MAISVVYWPSTRPIMPFPKWCTGRKWHIPMASNRKKSRRRNWLTKWDKVKAHDTLIDWCTGSEWPLNCMTVISAWRRSNMPFQRLSGRLSGRLNYYISRWDRKSGVAEKARRKLSPRVSGWASGERERHNADSHKSGGQYIAVLFGLQLPLTVKLWITLLNLFK